MLSRANYCNTESSPLRPPILCSSTKFFKKKLSQVGYECTTVQELLYVAAWPPCRRFVYALTRWQHSSEWNDVISAVLRWMRDGKQRIRHSEWVNSYLILEQSCHISARSHWNDAVFKAFWKGRQNNNNNNNKNNNNNERSNDIRMRSLSWCKNNET